MTTRTKIILLGATVTISSIIILLVINIFTNKPPEPISSTPPDVSQNTESPSEEDGTDHDHGVEFTEAEQGSMLLNGKQAAEAYVSQPANEPPADRQARLSRFFALSSPFITAPAPVTTTGYSTADVTPIETSWYPTGKPNTIGVVVYLSVEVNLPFDTRVENQTWNAELVQSGSSWLTNTVTKSYLPYIKGSN